MERIPGDLHPQPPSVAGSATTAEGTMCLAMAAAAQQNPVSILGNIAQQNMHVGYDLDKRTVTFAPADCASSYASAPAPSPSPSP
ncbi:hypothetical protein ACQ4PT_050117 [Festuca glaucescens]